MLVLVGCGLWLWHRAAELPQFDPAGKSEDELTLMEFNGDIIRTEDDRYIFNPEKQRGIPGPLEVVKRCYEQFSEPFHKKGSNDHGIGWLMIYTVSRFAIGYLAASAVAILVGTLIGLSRPLFQALNPLIQILKPISPLAWMPLLLYSVKDSFWTAVCVVFLASLWPTLANTAFGVNSMKRDYLQVARMLEMSWLRRLFTVILRAAAPAIVAGLRISFGSALIAVVPAEMLLGELGVGYLTWNYWNNLDIAGVLFAILIIGVVGVCLDLAFQRLSQMVTFAE
jgi:nitrate/nitrite transport system permease protein